MPSVERDVGRDFPLVLHVDAEIRVGLRQLGDAEGLRRIRRCCRCRRGSWRATRTCSCRAPTAGNVMQIVVVEEIDARAQGVRAALVREVVDHLIHLVQAARRAARARAECGDAGNADRGTDRVGWRRLQIAVRELRARLEHRSRREDQRVADREGLVEIVQIATKRSARSDHRRRASSSRSRRTGCSAR